MIQLVTSVYGLQKKEHDNSCLFYLVGGRFKNSAEFGIFIINLQIIVVIISKLVPFCKISSA